MPSGLISVVAWLAACILWWSGWRKELADGMPAKLVVGLLAVWPLAFRLHADWPGIASGLAWNGAIAWAFAVAAAACVRMDAEQRMTALAAALLIGAVVLFTGRIAEHAAVPAASDSVEWTPLMAALLALVIVRSPQERLAALSIGLALAEAAGALGPVLGGGQADIGGPAWSDRWWMAAGAVRAAAYLAAAAGRLLRRLERRRRPLR